MLNTPPSPSYLVDRLSLLCGLSMWKLVTSGPLTPPPRRSHVAQMISAFHCLAPRIFRQYLHQSGCKPLISRHFASADRRTYHRICRRDVILVRRCSCSRSGFAPSILPLLFTLICLVWLVLRTLRAYATVDRSTSLLLSLLVAFHSTFPHFPPSPHYTHDVVSDHIEYGSNVFKPRRARILTRNYHRCFPPLTRVPLYSRLNPFALNS